MNKPKQEEEEKKRNSNIYIFSVHGAANVRTMYLYRSLFGVRSSQLKFVYAKFYDWVRNKLMPVVKHTLYILCIVSLGILSDRTFACEKKSA